MKRQRIYLFALCILAMTIAACSSKKEKAPTGEQPTEFELAMTSQDTTAVKQVVDQFFTYVKGKNFDDAAAMLYRNDASKSHEPEQLNNEEMAQVRGMLRSIPMVDYKIEYIKFNEDYSNEVLCHVVIMKGENGEPDVTTKMFFKPVNYMGNWLLCLMNTEYGDKGVVKPSKRDSIEKEYAKRDNTMNKK